MSIIESIILGLVQGLTEFLPISSSGHLILVREFLNISLEGSLAFDIFLNTATLCAVTFCFWGDLKAIIVDLRSNGFSARSKTLVWSLVLGTLPAGLIGFFFGDQIENAFRESSVVALALIAGSILMFLADKVARKGGLSPLKGLAIGFFQALALIPGISRSGSSISGGLLVGLSREEAIKFSFLLLIPVSLGALLKVCLDLDASNFSIIQFFNIQSLIAFLAALLSGIWAVRFLVRYLSKNSFTPFIVYRLVLAVVILTFF